MGTHEITEDCTNCGACYFICPVGAILSGDIRHGIDPEICIDCGHCNNICPVDAIRWEDTSPFSGN